MSEDTKPKIVLGVPSNLKPEDLAKIMPDSGPTPDKYEFLAVESKFFANDKYVGIDFAWGVKGMGWGHVTLSCAREDHVDADGRMWARKGQWQCDTEMMSKKFVAAMLRHVADDLANQMDNDDLMNEEKA